MKKGMTRAKGQLVDKISIPRLPDIEITAGALAGPAFRILGEVSLSATKRSVINFVGP